MRIFLAGGTGVIGPALVRRLIEGGHDVTAITRKPGHAKRLGELGAEPVMCDVLDTDALMPVVEHAEPDVVIQHLTDLPTDLNPRNIKQAYERIFLLQQIPFDDQGRVEKLAKLYDGHPTKHWHESGQFTTINGVALPVISLRPGEVQRWRFIHSGIHESLTVRLDRHKLYEIAADGIPLGKMVPREEIELQPGNTQLREQLNALKNPTAAK